VTDYADLEKRLRAKGAWMRGTGGTSADIAKWEHPDAYEAAADALASLTRTHEDDIAALRANNDENERLTRELEEAKEARHQLGSKVNYVAGFLEVTAKRHERGALGAAEYSQRLTDCAEMLREANAGHDLSRAQPGQDETPK